MYSDQESPFEAPSRCSADEVRRRVVEAVSGTPRPAQPAEQPHLDVYLSLLQDRLPVYVGTVSEIFGRVGQASVRKNLAEIAMATIDFYEAVLPAKTSVLSSPSQLIRLRQMMSTRGLGPGQADNVVDDYLRREQELGRVGPDVDTLTVARLLIGACLSYVFNRTLLGGDDLPTSAEYATAMVHTLRLDP